MKLTSFVFHFQEYRRRVYKSLTIFLPFKKSEGNSGSALRVFIVFQRLKT